jgi:imidazolonepropionase-like amidohydrolase
MEMCIKAGFDTIEHGSFLTPEEVETMVKNGQTWVPTILPYVEIYNEYAALIESMGLSVAEIAGPDCDSYLAKVHEERPELDLSMINEELVDVIAYMDRCVVSYKANLRKYADMGVTIVAGTDMVSSNDPMVLVAKELKLMVEYGLTTLEAVKAAPSAPAKVLGVEKKYGLLEKGKIAEIAVVKGDVEKDITALEDCVATFMSGKKVYGE